VADSVQISCINKHQHHNPHERIQSVGGMHGGKPWKLTEEEAIAGIKQGKWNFYTSVSGRSVWVVIIRSRRQGGRTVSIAINTSIVVHITRALRARCFRRPALRRILHRQHT
jgi:hypothetical protein